MQIAFDFDFGFDGIFFFFNFGYVVRLEHSTSKLNLHF